VINHSRLEEVLDVWQSAYSAGRDVPIAELCRSCPELAGELERQIAVLRRAYTLAHPPGPATEPPTRSVQDTPTPSTDGALGSALPLQPRVGDRLGGFLLVRLLGEGGMGQVFEAEDEKLVGRRVALKVMHAHVAVRTAAHDRFLHEARAMALLQHDHIVPLYQVGEDNGVPFLVMPLLDGRSLERRLREDPPLTLVEILRVGRQTAAALAAAHAAGRMHRDIKPANLWLETQPHAGPATPWRVKVLDFGLSRVVETPTGLTPSGAVLGTPGYMAPEQATGEPADARSDLFSLGCVLYRLLAGKPPFRGATMTALLLAVVRNEPTPLEQLRPDLPAGLTQLVGQLLAKDPARRPSSARATELMLQALETEIASGRSAPTPDRTPTLSATVPMRRRRTWQGAALAALLLTAVALLLLVTVGINRWVATRPPSPPGPDKGTPVANPVGPAIQQTRYRGEVHVRIERQTADGTRLLDLTDPRALPMRRTDKFRIEAKVEPAAYLYAIWVDPGKDVTPLYPWDATVGWGSRPAREQPTTHVSLPANAGDRFTAPEARSGVATIVLLARATPLKEADEEIRGWFEALPELPLRPGGERGVVWFDDYVAVIGDGTRAGTLKVEKSGDPFAAWQGQLQQAVGPRAAFQTAISFARKDGP
jgi:serine/threonine protein kinase